MSRVSYLQSLLKVHKKLRINCVLIAERPSWGQLTYVFSFRVAISQLLECPFMTIPIPTSHQFVSYNIMQGMKTHNYLYTLPLTAVWLFVFHVWEIILICWEFGLLLIVTLERAHSDQDFSTYPSTRPLWEVPSLTLLSVNETCNSLLHPVGWSFEHLSSKWS